MLGNPPGDETGEIKLTQGWQVIPDPLGSTHYLIVSAASNLCIGIGANVAPRRSHPGYPAPRSVRMSPMTRLTLARSSRLSTGDGQ